MNDVFKRAREQQRSLPLEIMAHRVSAEAHRHWNMALGGLTTVLTTLVGTSIFTGLVSQFGLNGKGEVRNPFAAQGMGWLYLIVLLLSISTPVLAALHTFMHHAEDASTHIASAAGYGEVLRRLTTFLAKYDGSNPAPEKRDKALKEYDDIIKEYNSVLAKSLTLTRKAYEAAKSHMKESEQSDRSDGSKEC